MGQFILPDESENRLRRQHFFQLGVQRTLRPGIHAIPRDRGLTENLDEVLSTITQTVFANELKK